MARCLGSHQSVARYRPRRRRTIRRGCHSPVSAAPSASRHLIHRSRWPRWDRASRTERASGGELADESVGMAIVVLATVVDVENNIAARDETLVPGKRLNAPGRT